MRTEGEVLLNGVDVYGKNVDSVEVRRRVGMVFQKPNPFPRSIRENILYGAKINGYRGDYDELVERSLRQAAIWDEVKGKSEAEWARLVRRPATAPVHRPRNSHLPGSAPDG